VSLYQFAAPAAGTEREEEEGEEFEEE
jgi:hypothetical protein